MSGHKRTKAERERDLDKIAALYLGERTQAEIAGQLGVSRQQIGYDLKTLQERWLASSLSSFDANKARELAKIAHLERMYLEAWARSCEEKQTTSTERTLVGEAGKAALRKESRDGNPAFLEGVRWCIAERIKLRGLAPTTNVDNRVEAKLRITEIVVNGDSGQGRPAIAGPA
jgi:DNA-binding transcriptional regulator LsrR (DeoR family)